jgi:hypothetical protein
LTSALIANDLSGNGEAVYKKVLKKEKIITRRGTREKDQNAYLGIRNGQLLEIAVAFQVLVSGRTRA